MGDVGRVLGISCGVIRRGTVLVAGPLWRLPDGGACNALDVATELDDAPRVRLVGVTVGTGACGWPLTGVLVRVWPAEASASLDCTQCMGTFEPSAVPGGWWSDAAPSVRLYQSRPVSAWAAQYTR